MSDLIKLDKEYKDWLMEVSNRFRRSQIKASIKVNSELLKFYWLLGKDIDITVKQVKEDYEENYVKEAKKKKSIFKRFIDFFR